MKRFHFMPGDQVAYVPRHASYRLGHPDVEFGFIVSVNYEDEIAMVRYWDRTERDLRTKSCSEATPFIYLVPHMITTQLEVANAIRDYIGDETNAIILRRILRKENLEED